MMKKTTIVLCVSVILIVILLGLKTTTVYSWSEINKPDGPESGKTALMLYGTYLFDSSTVGDFHFLLHFGNYKYELIVAVVLVSALLLYLFKKKATEVGSR